MDNLSGIYLSSIIEIMESKDIKKIEAELCNHTKYLISIDQKLMPMIRIISKVLRTCSDVYFNMVHLLMKARKDNAVSTEIVSVDSLFNLITTDPEMACYYLKNLNTIYISNQELHGDIVGEINMNYLDNLDNNLFELSTSDKTIEKFIVLYLYSLVIERRCTIMSRKLHKLKKP